MDFTATQGAGSARRIIGLGTRAATRGSSSRKAGLHVVGYDVDQSKVDSLAAGKIYIPDVPSEELAAVCEAGTFRATTPTSVELADVDVIDICVPTPARENARPGPLYVVKAIERPAATFARDSSSFSNRKPIQARRKKSRSRRSRPAV